MICWSVSAHIILFSRMTDIQGRDFNFGDSLERVFLKMAGVVYACSILFYSIPGCVLPLQEVALLQSPLTFSVLCCPCPYHSLLSHNVISPFLCPLLSLSIPLHVALQCHLSNFLCPLQSLSIPLLVAHNVIFLTFSVLCFPCPYRSLLPHNVISPTFSVLCSTCPYRYLLPHLTS